MRKTLALLALALASYVCLFYAGHAIAAVPPCDWSSPGHDKYTGNYEAAMGHYQDIPAATRARFVSRMNAHDYDEMVTITNDKIVGRGQYDPELWGMHYGEGRMCMHVVRPTLDGPHTALAYTEGPYTVFVPSDCNNVSRGTRIAAPPAGAVPGGDGAGGYGPVGIAAVPGGGVAPREQAKGLVGPYAGAGVAPGVEPTLVAYGAPEGEAVPPAEAPFERQPAYYPGPIAYYPGPTRFIEVLAIPTAAVPEPATWVMMFLGMAILYGVRRARN